MVPALSTCDVVVLGGGPAGLATAIALADRGRHVVVLERSRFGGPRAGETLGPEIQAPLSALGVWRELLSQGPVPFRGVRSAWGSSELVERPAGAWALGDGIHVDREAFDRILLDRAAQAGVALHDEVRVAVVDRHPEGWDVRGPGGLDLRARVLVDASGRGAPAGAARVPGRRWLACDRQIALQARYEPIPGHRPDPMLLVESAEEGFWYAAPQPGGALIATLITDADVFGKGARGDRRARFEAALDRTVHMRVLALGRGAEPRVVRCDVGCLIPDRGPGWRAVGDAAMSSDPLSGNGLSRGMRVALEAARRIDRNLAGDDVTDDGLTSADALRRYLETRARYHALEGRWPDALFWKRRRPPLRTHALLPIDPRMSLRRASVDPAPAALAPIEAILPPRPIRAVVDLLARPTPAAEALSLLRELAPLGDRRLLLGLQELMAAGIVEAA